MSDLCLLAALAASQAKQHAQALSKALTPQPTEIAESQNDCHGEAERAIASSATHDGSVQMMAVERQTPEFSAPQPVADEAGEERTRAEHATERSPIQNVAQHSAQAIQHVEYQNSQEESETVLSLPSISDPFLSVPILPNATPSSASTAPPDRTRSLPDAPHEASTVSPDQSSHSAIDTSRETKPSSSDELLPITAETYASDVSSTPSPSAPDPVHFNSAQWSEQEISPVSSAGSSSAGLSIVEHEIDLGAGSSDARSPLLARIAVPQTKAVRPASGRQFFRQRWEALQAGRSYTRLASDSFAQQWRSATYEPSHEDWVSLLAQEANAMSRGQGSNRLTIMLGDSISLWFPSDYMARYRFWLNQSISGDTAAGTIRRLSLFSRTRPDTIHVMLGINDLRRGVSDAQLLNDQRYIMRRLRQQHPQAQVVVHSILPTRLHYLPSHRIQPINRQLEAIAQQEGAQFLNLQPYFADSEGNLRADLTTDGLHLNPQGYAMWYRVLSHFRLV